jgi:hypothetical protein
LSVVLGASALHARHTDAEHLLREVLGAVREPVTACTHLVDTPWRHEAVSVEGEPAALAAVADAIRRVAPDAAVVLGDREEGPADRRAGAREAAAAHRHRTGGRAVQFPGVDLLVGDVTVDDVVARTAIDRVESSHGEFAADAVVQTGGYVRPRYLDGELVLLVGHADPRRLMPWEVRNPTPCCGEDHPAGPLA